MRPPTGRTNDRAFVLLIYVTLNHAELIRRGKRQLSFKGRLQGVAAYAQKPQPEGRAVVVELDEMWQC